MSYPIFQKNHVTPILLSILALVFGYVLLRVIAENYITAMKQEVHLDIATTTHATIRDQAPTFVLPTLTGKTIALEEFAGGPLVIVFWSSWNSASTDQLALLDKISPDKYPGVRIVAINVQEEPSVVSNFISRSGYHTETLLDETGKVAGSYRAFSLPAVYFVDKAGVIQSIALGVLSESMMQKEIESIIY